MGGGQESSRGVPSLGCLWTSRRDAQETSAAHCTYSMLGRHSSSKSDFSSAFKSLWFRGSCLITAQLSTSFCQRGDIAESRSEATGNKDTTFE